MDLHLIRHARAEPVGSGRVRDDSQRPLSAAGREDAQRVAEKLRELGVAFDRIGSSPLMRAAQTAEIVAIVTGYHGRIDCLPFLARPGAWKSELPGLREEHPGGSAVALVGHNPDLGDLVTRLLDLPDGSFPFPPGGLVGLDLPPGASTAQLRFWIEPRTLTVHRRI